MEEPNKPGLSSDQQEAFNDIRERYVRDPSHKTAITAVVAALAVRQLTDLPTDEILLNTPLENIQDSALRRTVIRFACSHIKPGGIYSADELLSGLHSGRLQAY